MLTFYIRFFYMYGSLLETKSLLAYYFIFRWCLLRKFFSLFSMHSFHLYLPAFLYVYISTFSFTTQFFAYFLIPKLFCSIASASFTLRYVTVAAKRFPWPNWEIFTSYNIKCFGCWVCCCLKRTFNQNSLAWACNCPGIIQQHWLNGQHTLPSDHFTDSNQFAPWLQIKAEHQSVL